MYPGMGGLYAVSPQGETRRFDTWELGPQQVLEVKKAALDWAGVDHTDTETHDFRVSRAGRVRAGDAAAQPQAEKRALWVIDA